MKNTVKLLITVFIALILVAEIHAQTRMAEPNNPYAVAGPGQAEIIINAENADKDIAVWINGVIAAHIRPKTSEKIIVPNGRNTVEAADSTANRSGQWSTATKRQIVVDSNSNRVTIGLNTRYGSLLSLAIQQTIALGGVQTTPGDQSSSSQSPTTQSPTVQFPTTQSPATQPSIPAVNSGGFYNALKDAAKTLEDDIPSGATLAIMGIATGENRLASEVIEELTYLMVNARKFTVVDRLSLNAIMEERQFQYSGEVDDRSAVDIGKMIGASIVITGSVTDSGSTRRLTLKALDVLTARIVAMARQSF